MRRLAAAAAGVLALLTVPLAAPASAHSGTNYHRVSWGADAPDDGERLYGTDFVTVRAQFTDYVAKWRVEMRPENGGPAVSFCEAPETRESTDLTFPCNWDTRRYGDMTGLGDDQELGGAPVAPNGRYLITATVWNRGRDNLLSSDVPAEAHVLAARTVIVENPVSAPTGVGSSFDSGARRITVNWNPNPEPDITEYVIEQKVGDGEWTEAGRRDGRSTSFQRDIAEAGTYRYRVTAVRPNADPSAPVEAAPLEVASIPEAAPSGAGDGSGPAAEGDPGVFIPEDPTTTTSGPTPPTSRPKPAASGGSSLFSRPSATSLRPSAPRSTTPTTEYDPGYTETLPYALPQNGAEEDPEEQELAGGEEPQTMTKIISVPKPRDPRALLVPLAGGMAMFIFSMQITVMMRRRPVLADTEDDFGDWMGL